MKEMMKEMVGGCCVCSDERGWPDNPLVYCDGNGCTVAVHQACYGIIAVPTGPWYCRKCESPETKGKVRCELCPSKSGALKRSDTGGWAHVVCALYIPEVRFGNVTSMEPIVLRLIPPERYNKTCYICQDLGKTHRANAGACMQCNKSGCKQQFHVTCAQSLGLLCEEAGNYLDNVKYCGYCQHHYSKLKKGGNVKTIPPYKPVSHDSRSDSSEREIEPSGAPHFKRGPGRKSSHSSGGTSGKNTPNSAKTPTNSSQPMDKKKPSPSRRGSCAESTSKTSTPAPSPQHVTEQKGCSTSINTAKIPLPPESPGKEGVISSVASIAAIPIPPSTSTTTVVQTSKAYESVITNTDAVDNKQTKKRKAVTPAPIPAQAPLDYATSPAPVELSTPGGNGAWEQQSSHGSNESNLEVEKVIKKAKTEVIDSGSGGPFSNISSAPPPPPPPAHSPAAHATLQSPRHLPSPMPGPSGLNQASNIRSPSQHQMKEREGPAPTSLLVSVPLPSASHGLNLSAHAHAHVHAHAHTQIPLPSPIPEMGHIFHQAHKQAAMEPGLSHSPHARPWGGLNVSYELQDPNKPGVSGIAGTSKETLVGANLASMPGMGIPPAMRNKKRAAMATSMATSMANTPPPPPIQTATAQNLTSIRRAPQPTPPPVYHEIIKDSPPSSPSSERPLKPKLEHNLGGGCAAPHMLGNELNPESGAAARLQEQLSAELAAHAAGSANAHDAPVPPPLINKAAPRSGAQSLDQLLERQWEQGSQFLMEQAQHFDIASLLSCLHQLRTENVRLEEHVGSLLQRRDHLLAVNARLAIPLAGECARTDQTGLEVFIRQSDNNKHNLVSGPGEPVRCPRENGAPVRAPPVAGRPAEAVGCDRHQVPYNTTQLMIRDMQQKPS